MPGVTELYLSENSALNLLIWFLFEDIQLGVCELQRYFSA